MFDKKTALVICVVAVLSAGCLGLGGSDDPAENVSDGGPPEQAPDDDTVNGNGPDDGDDELPDAETIQTEISESGFEFESFQGVLQLDIETDDQRLSGTYDVWERSADELRVEVVDRYISTEADLLVSDGEETWWYSEQKNRHDQGEFGGFIGFEGGMELFSNIGEDTNVTVEGTDVFLDRDVVVLNYTQDDEDADIIDSIDGTIFLDQETRYPLKIEQETTADGVAQTTTTAEFTELTFNPDLEDDLFEFEIPEGSQPVAEIEDQAFDTVAAANEQLPFNVVEPEVSANLTVEQAQVFERLTATQLAISYQNETGDNRNGGFPLFVTVTDNPSESELTGEGETSEISGTEVTIERTETDTLVATQISFETDGLEYIISGDLSEEELIEVAESIIIQTS